MKNKYYNPDYGRYYETAEEFVRSLDKEGIEAGLSRDYTSYDEAVMKSIKKLYPNLYKKYPLPFKRILDKLITLNFSLPDKDGNIVSLEDFKGKWLIIYFYPKDNTPGCTIESVEFTKNLQEFKKINAEVIGISADSEKSHCNFTEKNKLKIILLSDVKKEIIKQYGAWGKKNLYGKENDGIIRSTFIISPEQKLVKSYINIKAQDHVAKVLEDLKELQWKN